jgi:hypothetical protein
VLVTVIVFSPKNNARAEIRLSARTPAFPSPLHSQNLVPVLNLVLKNSSQTHSPHYTNEATTQYIFTKMHLCAEAICTKKVIGRICIQHKIEPFKSCATMHLHCKHERTAEGATPQEGLNEVMFGWLRGARTNSVHSTYC